MTRAPPRIEPIAGGKPALFIDVHPVAGALERLVDIEHVLEVPPVRLAVVPGFETAAFAFTTDIPMLPSWGRPLLYGPGSVRVAHTPHEHVRIEELHEAVDGYVRLAQQLMAE